MRTISRRKFVRLAARGSVGAAGIALVGCGGDDDQPAAPVADAPQPAQAEPQAEPEAEPQAEADTSGEQMAEQTATQPATQPPAEAPASTPRRQLDPDRQCADCLLPDPTLRPLLGSRVGFGVHEGAAYRMEVPANWNGTLLLWARGFSGLNDEGTGFNPQLGFGAMPFRELLLPAGIGWLASTYRSNGFVAALGVDDLLKTKDLFRAEFGQPTTAVCAGFSMGGATAQLMAQEFPDEIDGAIALCGALSNVEVVDYLASFHALAMHFIGQPPSRVDASGLTEWGRQLGQPDGAGGLTLTGPGQQFVSVIRELTGGERWGFEEGLAEQWDANFGLGTTVWPAVFASGQSLAPGSILAHDATSVAFDTREAVYRAGPEALLDATALNEQVIRFAPPPGTRENPALGPASGSLKVPLLTVKGTGDLFTPISLDQSYGRLVRAAGDEANLVQRAVRRAGHCDFSLSESVGTLLDMTDWLGRGIRPEGEDLSGDLTAAGIDFTSPFDDDDPFGPAGNG